MIKKKLTADEYFALAIENHKKKNFHIAEKFYDETLKQNPNNLDALNNLGMLLNQKGKTQKAKNCLKKAIKINPNYDVSYNNLGLVLKQLGEYKSAKNCYEKAIQINKNYDAAHYNLGNILKQLGEKLKAINCYEKAIQINPNYEAAYYNLGNTFEELGKHQKAINCYEKTIKINANYLGAHNNLGNIFEKLGDHKKAINCYEKAIQINPNYIDAYNNLGNVLKQLGKHQRAMACYEKAIKIEPDNLTSHWLFMNNFPIIYKNLEEVDYYRKKFGNSIKQINKILDTKKTYTKKEFLNAISSSTNFYLHYQGKDVLELQKSYAYLIERITKKIYQEFHQKRKKNIPLKGVKIGFISAFFRNHTVSKLFKNFVLKLDHKLFKKFVYFADDKSDHITNEIKNNVDHFFYNSDVDKLINQISNDCLDMILYLDIGMTPKIQILSSLRLAPFQFNTWGHPITSGFKNIDYYLSGELMETHNSQIYYSEKLINLPNLGINYNSPNLSSIKKLNIPNKSNKTIFLNLQSLFKLLPEDDHIYLDIIKKHPNCCFWFLEAINNSITSTFKDRISKLFQKEGYNFERYSYFHPRCSQDEFFGLIKESDIILDSLNWSGGNTSLEAVSLNKPIVTYPSNFMRGRHTYAILKILDINETIASSKKKYTEIAVKLGSDIKFRNFIINKIKKNKKKLFNDDKPIRFFEEFIRKII